MKKSSTMNELNMSKVSGFFLYSAYFAWEHKIESRLLPHDLTHAQFMLLMTLGALKKDRADVSQNDIAKFLSFDGIMTSHVLRAMKRFLRRFHKERDERSKSTELTDADSAKIQGAAKLLKAEKSFFKSVEKNKQGFDEHWCDILQQKIAGTRIRR